MVLKNRMNPKQSCSNLWQLLSCITLLAGFTVPKLVLILLLSAFSGLLLSHDRNLTETVIWWKLEIPAFHRHFHPKQTKQTESTPHIGLFWQTSLILLGWERWALTEPCGKTVQPEWQILSENKQQYRAQQKNRLDGQYKQERAVEVKRWSALSVRLQSIRC